jgi:hypothetical protein
MSAMKKYLTKFFIFGAVVAGVVFVATAIYGIANYSAAPIRQDGATFRDKQGKLYTVEEYHRFNTWKMTLIVSGAATFALAFAGQAISGSKRKT